MPVTVPAGPGPADLETRELRYFVAVAEELHFGRAATRLGLAQPPLSRAIGRLERRLGTMLFVRGPRGVSLTAGGEVLLVDARAILSSVAAATRRVRRAAEATPRLALVLKPGGDVTLLRGILDAFATLPDAVPVDVDVCAIGEQGTALREGRADVALLHLPYDDLDGFDVEVLRTEGQVAVMAADHPLAGRRALTLDDLAGEVRPRWPGDPVDDRPLVRDSGQLLHLAALGRVVAVVPESVRRNARPELAYVPVPDAGPTSLVVAWPTQCRSRTVAAFVRAATGVATGERDHVRAVQPA